MKSEEKASFTSNDIQSDLGISDGFVDNLEKQVSESAKVQKSQSSKDSIKRKRKQGKQSHQKSSRNH